MSDQAKHEATLMHPDDVKQAYLDGLLRYDEAIIRLWQDNGMSLVEAIKFCPDLT